VSWIVVVVASSTGAMQAEDSEQPEPVWEVRDTPSTLFVRVASKGCTEERDFRVEKVTGNGDLRSKIVRIVRIKPDHCKMRMTSGKLLTFEKKSIGLGPDEPFQIVNPFLGSAADSDSRR
jgi:hypothetical protein